MAKPSKTMVNFRFDDDLVEELKKISDETNISQTDIVAVALREKLQRLRNRIEQGKEIAISI